MYFEDIDELSCAITPAGLFLPQFAALGANSTRRGNLSLSTVDSTIGDNFSKADPTVDAADPSGFNRETNSIFNQVAVILIQSTEISAALGTSVPQQVACCRLEPTTQYSVAWYYRRYGLKSGLLPTDFLYDTLSDRNKVTADELRAAAGL